MYQCYYKYKILSKKIIINTRSLVRQKSFAFPTCFQKHLRQPSIFRMVKILVLNLCCNKKLGYTKVTSKFVVCLKGIVVVCNQWWSKEFSLGEAKLKAKLIDINSKINTQIYINVIWRLI